jgi:hypothetical protein
VIDVLASPAGEAAKAGPWWGAVVLLLCLACWLLFRSMSKHLRKVRDEFPTEKRTSAPSAKPVEPPAQQDQDDDPPTA